MKEVALGEILELRYGKALSAKNRSGKGNPVYASGGRVGYHDDAVTNGAAVVIGRKGSIGSAYFSETKCWPIDTTYYVDATCTNQNLRWLFRLLSSLPLHTMNKSAAVPGLNRDDVYRLRVNLPNKNEQRRIACILDKAETLRTKRRAAIAHLDTLSQAIFHEMFGDPLEVNAEEAVPFSKMTTRITYGFTSPMKHLNEGIPILTGKNVQRGVLDVENVHYADPKEFEALTDKSKPKIGDVLITKDGTIGRSAVVEIEPICINQSVALIQLEKSRVTPRYVQGLISHSSVQRKFQGMKKGNSIPHLQITELAAMPVRMAPVQLQNEFTSRVSSVERLKVTHRAQLTELDNLFRSLQDSAFKGEL